MLSYNGASRLLTTSALYFVVVLAHRATFLDSRYCRMHKSQFQIAITILAAGFMSSVISTVLAAGYKPTITGKLPVRRKPFNIPDFRDNGPGNHLADSRYFTQSLDRFVEPDCFLNPVFDSLNLLLSQADLLQLYRNF